MMITTKQDQSMLTRMFATRRTWMVVIPALVIATRMMFSVVSSAGSGWDFANYYRVAVEMYNGRSENLFATDPLISYAGVPISAYLLAPLGALPVREALFAFKAVCAACLFVGLWLFYPVFREAAGRKLGVLAMPVYLAVAALYAPLWYIFSAGGQVTAINFVLLIIFHRLYLVRRMAWGALAITVCVLTKPFFAPMLFVLLIAGEYALVFWAGLFLTAWMGLSLSLLGLGLHYEWIELLHQSAYGFIEPWWNNSAMWSPLDTLWLSISQGSLEVSGKILNPWAKPIIFLRLLTMPILGWLAWRSTRINASPGRQHVVSGLAIAFCFLVSAVVWPHYLVFLLPVLCVTACTSAVSAKVRVVSWAAIISTLAVQSRPLQTFVLDLFASAPVLRSLIAGAFSACTLLLLCILIGFLWSVITKLSAPVYQNGELRSLAQHG